MSLDLRNFSNHSVDVFVNIAMHFGANTLEDGLRELAKDKRRIMVLAKEWGIGHVALGKAFRQTGIHRQRGAQPGVTAPRERIERAQRGMINTINLRVVATGELFVDYMKRVHGINSLHPGYNAIYNQMRRSGEIQRMPRGVAETAPE